MITVDGYNLYYDTAHLLSPKPETYSEVIDRLEPLECNLFYNIVSSPDCRYEKRFADGRIKDHYKTMDAESRFKNIFSEKIIYANPKSFFVNKLTGLPKDCDEIKSVSFAFCNHTELPRHFLARGSEFGICFFHDFLQNQGLRPVEYLGDNDADRNRKLVFNSPHLIEVYSSGYDMRWEREWRINSDLHFTQDDIAFVIVPQEKFNYYLGWFLDTEDFEDVKIISSNTFKSYVDHLIFYPQQGDNSWNQIEILRDSDGNGFKISPEEFNNLDQSVKDKFLISHLRELNCFAKNTLLANYEYAYTNRFIKFYDKLSNPTQLGSLFQDYQLIKANLEEPEDAQRDLVRGLFGELFLASPHDF